MTAVEELYIVIGKDGFVREQYARQSFESVVNDIISGQYDDVERVLRIWPPKVGWPHHHRVEEATEDVAGRIFTVCGGDSKYVTPGSAGYKLVEEHCGLWHAQTCLSHEVK